MVSEVGGLEPWLVQELVPQLGEKLAQRLAQEWDPRLGPGLAQVLDNHMLSDFQDNIPPLFAVLCKPNIQQSMPCNRLEELDNQAVRSHNTTPSSQPSTLHGCCNCKVLVVSWWLVPESELVLELRSGLVLVLLSVLVLVLELVLECNQSVYFYNTSLFLHHPTFHGCNNWASAPVCKLLQTNTLASTKIVLISLHQDNDASGDYQHSTKELDVPKISGSDDFSCTRTLAN